MSIKAMTWVWEHADVSGSELLVLLALADFASDSGLCWPAVETLARKSRTSSRQVQRLIRSLESRGLLTVETSAGRGKVNRYRLVMGDKLTPIPTEKHDNTSPIEPEKVTPRVVKGDIAMSPRTVRNRQKKEEDGRKAPDWSSVENLDQEWWALWLAYRRKHRIRAYADLRMAKRLAKYPIAVQQAAIDESMTQGWQGLFPEKVKLNGSSGTGGAGRFEQSSDRLRRWLAEVTAA